MDNALVGNNFHSDNEIDLVSSEVFDGVRRQHQASEHFLAFFVCHGVTVPASCYVLMDLT